MDSIRYWCRFAAISVAIHAVALALGVSAVRHVVRETEARRAAAPAPVVWDTEVLLTEAGYVQHGYSRTGAVVWRQVPDCVLRSAFGGR